MWTVLTWIQEGSHKTYLPESHLLSGFMTSSPLLRSIRFRSQSRTPVVSHAAQPSRVGNLRRELQSKSGFSDRQSKAIIEIVDRVMSATVSHKFDSLILKGQVSQASKRNKMHGLR